jgi:hypothetical protein
MNKFSKDLVKSLCEACDHAEGRASSTRVHVIEVPDVRAIQRKLRMSQDEFARKYRIPLPTQKKLGARSSASRRAGGGLPSRDRVAPARN